MNKLRSRVSYSQRACVQFCTILLLVISCLILSGSEVQAQNIQYTKNAADPNLRGNLTVNPATRAVELQIPLGDYPGRAGSNLPVTISYSSKV